MNTTPTRLLAASTALLMSFPSVAQEFSHGGHRVFPKENPGPGDRGYLHREYHHTYQHWHNVQGVSCCGVDAEHGDGDCRVTIARWENGGWFALVDGEWRHMPTHKYVADDHGLGPFATVCVGQYGSLYCFDPPESGA